MLGVLFWRHTTAAWWKSSAQGIRMFQRFWIYETNGNQLGCITAQTNEA